MRLPRIVLVVFLALGGALFAAPYAEATTSGLTVEVYTYTGNTPEHSALPEYVLCSTTVDTAWTSAEGLNNNFDAEYGGTVAGCQSDFVLVHYSGWMTWPTTEDVILQSWADDGFILSLDGETVISDWYLKGCGGSQATHSFTANVPQRLDAWFYEYGGGACNILGQIREGQYVPIDASVYSQDEPVVEPPKPYLLPPINISYVVDGTKIIVGWDTPEVNAPIERYAITWTYGDNAGWGIGVDGNSVEITGLPEETLITLKLRTDNDTLSLYSEYSEPFTLTTGKNIVVEPPVDPPVDPPVEPPTEPEPTEEPTPEPTPEDTPDVNPTVEPTQEPTSDNGPPVEQPNLNEIDPALIDPANLSDGEVASLIAYANDVLANTEQGSPEYEQALEQLFVAAQADDIQVDPAIANIPLLGNATVAIADAINYFGNVGSDMSPKVRETAKKEVVASVIVTQIAVQASGLAAQTAIGGSGASTPSNRKIK